MRYAKGKMADTTDYDFGHLAPVDARLGRMFARPKTIAAGCVVVIAGLGWLYLALTAAPGSSWLAAMETLCRALPDGTWNFSAAAVTASMWSAMAMAMMLPSAAPMILTYAEIAETAARKGERIVSPLVIAAGYASVWFLFSIAATAMQVGLTRAALLDPGLAPAGGFLAVIILVGAGLYQFSPLKHACLARCQHPFPFFFANWATTPGGVFRLGVRQGLYCLGCCWAMMLVMFAVGVMNVVWMAGLAAVMTMEKLHTERRFAHGVGVVLIAIGAGIAVSVFAAHWR
jgi:predicted metal-binding membrane protein